MIAGRAGRPQFDSCGVAVIMTSQESYKKWIELSSGRQQISSKLHEEFIEHLNTEVALGTVQNAAMAISWFEATFWGVQTPEEKRKASHESIKAALNKLSASLRCPVHLLLLCTCLVCMHTPPPQTNINNNIQMQLLWG